VKQQQGLSRYSFFFWAKDQISVALALSALQSGPPVIRSSRSKQATAAHYPTTQKILDLPKARSLRLHPRSLSRRQQPRIQTERPLSLAPLSVPSASSAMAPRRRLLAEAPPGDHHKRGAPPPPEWTDGWLSQPTAVFGLRLWVLIGIAAGAAIVLALLLIFICLSRRRRREDLAATLYPSDAKLHMQQQATPTKDIQEIVRRQQQQHTPPPQQQRAQAPLVPTVPARKTPAGSGTSAATSGGSERGMGTPRSAGPEVSHLGWGHWFTLRELEEATDGLAEENVIGEGGYGIVYRGTLHDSTTIAVKNLLNNR
jgi:hypothetical protein